MHPWRWFYLITGWQISHPIRSAWRSNPKLAAHLEILKGTCTPLSLEDAVRRAKERSLPRRTVAITFDDGFADNLLNAKPLAERHEIPMTVFVTVGQVGAGNEFWWDELERILLRTDVLPQNLELEVDGRKLSWQLGESDGWRRHLYESWHVQCSDTPTPRHSVYRSLCDVLRPLCTKRRSAILEQLRSWSCMKTTHRKTHLALTPEQLTILDRSDFVTIGAHTMTHALLSSVSAEEQEEEIRGSKTALEEMLGHPVSTFAYPFGARGDYNGASVSAVRNTGFALACANFPGVVWRRTDPFQLPRLLVRDRDGAAFDRFLDGWLR